MEENSVSLISEGGGRRHLRFLGGCPLDWKWLSIPSPHNSCAGYKYQQLHEKHHYAAQLKIKITKICIEMDFKEQTQNKRSSTDTISIVDFL